MGIHRDLSGLVAIFNRCLEKGGEHQSMTC